MSAGAITARNCIGDGIERELVGKIVVDHANMPDDAGTTDFVRLITSHQLDLDRYVYSLLPDANEAAEVVQETNVVLWEKRNQFDPATDFRAWAFQIARYKLMEHRARRGPKCLCFSDALIDELGVQALQCAVVDNELMDGLRRCIAELAARDRELLSRRYSSPTTCAGIAEQIGRTVTWVYNALRRIRRELLDCVARYAGTGRER